jgi:UDP-glucose 4-epimerase
MSDSITVIGSQGFIGGYLVSEFRRRGRLPWCPDRNADLRHRSLGDVYYCAGLTADFIKRPFETVEAHVTSLARLLSEGNFEKLIYLSSTRLYDSIDSRIAKESSSLRLDPSSPRHLYDLSKALGENLCLTASAGRAKVVRLSCVIGKRLEDPGYVPALLKAAIAEHHMASESSLGLLRDYIGISDVIELLIRIAECGKRNIYNLASGRNVSNADLFMQIKELTGCEITSHNETAELAPSIDVSALFEEFKFNPTGIDQLLREMLNSVTTDPNGFNR